MVGEDTKFALCKICEQSVPCSGRTTKTYNTTNLVHHLKIKHSKQYTEFEDALETGKPEKEKGKGSPTFRSMFRSKQ